MHNIHHSTYPVNVDKKEVQRYWDNYAAQEDWEEGCTGLGSDIRWINHVCDSYEDAERYLEAHDRGFYDQLAVAYRKVVKSGSKTDEIAKDIRAQKLVVMHLKHDFYFKGHKSQYKGCQQCGSQLNLSYLEKYCKNACPVCGADLRPESHIKKIAAATAKLNSLEKKLETEKNTKRRSDAEEIRWLVKIEFHT